MSASTSGLNLSFSLEVPRSLQPQKHRPPSPHSPPEDSRRVRLDLPQHRPEVRRRGQGIVGVPILVPVLEIQRPFAVGLRIPDSGDIGLDPDGLVLPMGSLLEERDGHSLGDISDADLVLGVLGDQIHDEAVEMGFGGYPDGVWNGHWIFWVSLLELLAIRLRRWDRGSQGEGYFCRPWLNTDTGVGIAFMTSDLNHAVQICPISGMASGLRRPRPLPDLHLWLWGFGLVGIPLWELENRRWSMGAILPSSGCSTWPDRGTVPISGKSPGVFSGHPEDGLRGGGGRMVIRCSL